jgi:hypothetical protein
MTVNQHRNVGRRVRLVSVQDQYTHLLPGDEGTITRVGSDPWGVIYHITWDSGSQLSLCADQDRFLILPSQPGGQPVIVGPPVVDIEEAPPVTSPPGAQTLPPATISAPSADDVARASQLWDDALIQALAARGVTATGLGNGAVRLDHPAVQDLILRLPVARPSSTAVGTRQPSR